MSTPIRTRRDLPPTTWGYVVASDTFLDDTVVLPVADPVEARLVEEYARSRSDMRRVRTVGSNYRPRFSTGRFSAMTREEATAWYPERCPSCGTVEPRYFVHEGTPPTHKRCHRPLSYNAQGRVASTCGARWEV